jgi:hypothetical protein
VAPVHLSQAWLSHVHNLSGLRLAATQVPKGPQVPFALGRSSLAPIHGDVQHCIP